MLLFNILLKTNEEVKYSAPNREELLRVAFDGDEDKFRSHVEKVMWVEKGLQTTEIVETGEIKRQVVGADTNPYGWRNEVDDQSEQ
ncbi:MAG: hypothetical protein LAT68_09795 [Cyclobacteriaceae bacterium]|nr:hypothetical protein [Cyclobacteriaceae bacterium]MCH8516608.1 hypothetical protein [Cyclobacteriaceae bacterium]